jgi:hypothetical protein
MRSSVPRFVRKSTHGIEKPLPLPSGYDLSATTNVVRSLSSADYEDMQRGPLARRWRQKRLQIAPRAAASHAQRRPVARTASLRRSSSDDVQRVEATLNARVLAG